MNAQDQVDTILKPMTLTQRAVCGLSHETGHELLYLPGYTSQTDLKDMSYYLMILDELSGPTPVLAHQSMVYTRGSNSTTA